MINTDNRLLLYTCMQYGYHKHVRTNLRINTYQLTILSAIYYGNHINPQRWQRSIKQCVKTLNPHMNGYYIIRDINILNDRGLIDYSERHPKDYSIKLTKEGKAVIERLFDPKGIDAYLLANKDKK